MAGSYRGAHEGETNAEEGAKRKREWTEVSLFCMMMGILAPRSRHSQSRTVPPYSYSNRRPIKSRLSFFYPSIPRSPVQEPPDFFDSLLPVMSLVESAQRQGGDLCLSFLLVISNQFISNEELNSLLHRFKRSCTSLLFLLPSQPHQAHAFQFHLVGLRPSSS